jgi:hypothetical protein
VLRTARPRIPLDSSDKLKDRPTCPAKAQGA